MQKTIIQAESLGKRYRLGVINRGMLYKDIQSWWAKVRGKGSRTAELVTGQGCTIVLAFENSGMRVTDRVSIGVSVLGAGIAEVYQLVSGTVVS